MAKDITGHWLILYPKEAVTGSAAHWLYEEIEDSIAGLMGLKLVSFTKDGIFRQQDSILHQGKWILSDVGELFVSDGGKGFDHFRCIFYGYDKGILQLKEKMSIKGETVTVTWHFKKISKDDKAFSLFEETENKWRMPSKEIESDSEIKDRVVAMLRYYAAYYRMVQTHTDYFIPQRVMLPFKFYQRGMGLPKFDTANVFTGFFYSVRQAKLAHRWMDQAMSNLRNSYPSADNYVEGYSKFMTMMADEIKDKDEEEKEDTRIFKQ